MNNKVMQNYDELARTLGLRLDIDSGALYGSRGVYDVLLYAQNANYPYMLSVTISVQRPAGPLSKEDCKNFKRENKPVASLTQKGTCVTMNLKNYPKPTALQDNVSNALNALITFLHAAGFQNCCQSCGTEATSACYVSGGYMHLCPDCYAKMQHNSAMAASAKENKNENVIAGVVGALLGSLVGVLSIIIFSQLGYIAILSGIIMAICTLKGYELLAGKLTKKGIIISVLVMIIMTYVGDRLDWAIVVMNTFDVPFTLSYQIVPELLYEEVIDMATYVGNLVMQYLFVLLGAVPTVINSLRNNKVRNCIYRLGESETHSDSEVIS